MLKPPVLALKIGGTMGQGTGQPLEPRKGKEPIFFDPLEEKWPSNILILAPWDPFQDFDLKNCKIIFLCCFKPLGWCSFVTVSIGN